MALITLLAIIGGQPAAAAANAAFSPQVVDTDIIIIMGNTLQWGTEEQ